MTDLTKWHDFHKKEAQLASMMSIDPSSKVGAVIVDFDHQQLVRGWNGFPRKMTSMQETTVVREIKYEYIVHAEMNCIFNAARRGISLQGTSIYVFGVPTCLECAKALVQVGVIAVYGLCFKDQTEKWLNSYEKTKALLKEVNIYCEMQYV